MRRTLSPTGRRGPAAIAAVLLLSLTAATAAETLATFEKKDWVGVDWPRTLVTYRVEFAAGEARPDALRLVDAEGEVQTFQLWRVRKHDDGSIAEARLSFFTALPKNGRYRYTLKQGKRPARGGALQMHRDDAGRVVLSNGHTSLRLPRSGRRDFDKPRPFEANDDASGRNAAVPGPIQGAKLHHGVWTEPAYFWAADPGKAPRFTGYTCEVLERGPLFVEARVRYRLTGDRDYQCRVRLRKDDAAARIDEQADFRQTRGRRNWRVVVPLSSGDQKFAPDAAYWASKSGRLSGRARSFEKAITEAGFQPFKKRPRSIGSRTFGNLDGRTKLFDVAVWYPYHSAAQYFGLTERKRVEEASEPGGIPFLAVVPMHAGDWRGAPEKYNGQLYGYAGNRAAMHWPLTVSPHPNTLLHTGEYDPGMPYTFQRRRWALVAGPMQYQRGLHELRGYDGYITLDDYKDWTLTWDGRSSHPRLAFTAEDVERLKGKLDGHPAGDTLKQYLYFNEDADRRSDLFDKLSSSGPWNSARGHVLTALAWPRQKRRPLGCHWIQGFRHAQRAKWVHKADELLASEKLSETKRRKLRAWVAAVCHALAEPDFNPRGMMSHLGNPNMPINRFFGLTFAAALIPEHPRGERWLDVSEQYLRYKLAMNTAPNNAWSELISYYNAAATHLMQAALTLDQTGRLNGSLAALASRAGRFPLHLITPEDPRFAAHAIPGWGHGSYWSIGTQWLPVAGFTRDRNPALSEAMVWGWDRLGRPMDSHHDAGFSPRAVVHADLLNEPSDDDAPGPIASRWLPGFGATMRAHAGSKDETYLSYRQGYLVSHSDANQGDFVLYSKGAPLTTLSVFQYALHQYDGYKKMYNEFGWFNRVRFGQRTNTGGWPGGGPRSQVHRHFTSDSADYLRGDGRYGPQRWARQILFLKGDQAAGPNYFVFRESLFNPNGEAGRLQKSWWNLGTQGDKQHVQTDNHGMTYRSPWGPRLDVRFLSPSRVKFAKRDASGEGPMYHQAAINWKDAGSPVASASNNSVQVRETTTVTSFGPIEPGKDMLVALYPREKGGDRPAYRKLADGVAKIETSESTDYVFLGRKGVSYEGDRVRFDGKAGAVRVEPDRVHLIVAEGPGRVSYRGTTLEAGEPATRVLKKDQLNGQTIRVEPPEHTISFDHVFGDRDAKMRQVRPGVTRHDFDGGFAYAFKADQSIQFAQNKVQFVGRRGGVIVHEKTGKARLILERGRQVGYKHYIAAGGPGPYELTYHENRITGRTAGGKQFAYLTRPDGLDRLPTLVIDGQTYAPGTSGDFSFEDLTKTGDPYDPSTHGGVLIVPMLEGKHELTVRALKQPDVFRNWQAWRGSLPGPAGVR